MKHDHHKDHHHHVEANHQIQHEYPRGVKFCPMCGGALEVRTVAPDDQQQKVCTRCGFIYFLNPKLVAGCIIAEGERALLIRRGFEPARGKWTYPGGFVDFGETPPQCAIRETVEEIGMTIGDPQLLGVFTDRREAAPNIVTIAYVAKPGADGPVVTAEATEVRYFAADDIPWNELAFDTTIQAFEAWLASIGRKR